MEGESFSAFLKQNTRELGVVWVCAVTITPSVGQMPGIGVGQGWIPLLGTQCCTRCAATAMPSCLFQHNPFAWLLFCWSFQLNV
jgi:hypothetical protein